MGSNVPRGTMAYMDTPGELSFREYDLPEDVEPGALLLEVIQSNVCGSELHIFGGGHPALKSGGLGHEMVGRIIKCGADVTTDNAGQPVALGDRVTPYYLATCNRCRSCRAGLHLHCENRFKYYGRQEQWPHFHGCTFATHYYLHADQMFFKVPDSIPDGPAAAANCALSQVLFGLESVGVTSGQRLVIQGAGGLGINAVAVAKDKGAEVAIIDRVPARLALAKEFGADHVVDMNELPTPEARITRILELYDGWGADVAVEVTGVPSALTEGMPMIRLGGTYLVMGAITPGQKTEIDPGILTRRSVTMRGVTHYPPHYLFNALQFLERTLDRYPYGKLLDQSFELSEVKTALEKSAERSVVRATIVM